MRRTASEVLHNLEMRVARLERGRCLTASSRERYVLSDDEITAVHHASGYIWADIVAANLKGNVLTLGMAEQYDILDSIDQEGVFPRLNERSGLFDFLKDLDPS